ncbi:hypothetical protein [Paenibacillus sp. MMS20-IR301]|uniref:hypothetical protein n=1 Tax=Paenibacillus sp. MMS20-IR301 TaxID=2895946 RepID=UPI0028E74A2C|nr:hypothetical protein [Paenibacillus sp. MMS20-IR301]WNS42040.1 hypothetical protein LOS79_23955 [Paenibacillus sp. MMS20-IR301]
MLDLLCKLDAERWDWTMSGVEEFQSGFLGLQERGDNKQRVTIGVYGPTQVGKTTLILKILGIRDMHLVALSKALRGNRAVGNSATVTSTNYRQSEDDIFHVYFPGGQVRSCADLPQLAEVMTELRETVESEESYPTRPITIQLARFLFDQTELARREQTIEILDLPGDDGKEEREKAHVDRCLKDYLPHCNVCILMEISSQLVQLTQLQQEHVRDWQWQPSKFRIVLTRAISDSSVKRRLTQDAYPSPVELQQEYRHELTRLLADDRSCRVEVYPLEFGDSWDSIERNDPELYRKSKPLVDAIYSQLIQDLSATCSPRHHIIRMMDLDGLVEKRSHEASIMYKQELAQNAKMLKENMTSQKVLAIKETKLEHSLEHCEIDLQYLKQLTFTKPSIHMFPGWSERTWKQCSANLLKNEFMLAVDKLANDYERLLKDLMKTLERSAKSYELTCLKVNFAFVKPSVSIDKFIDRYWSESAFSKDLAQCETVLKEANDREFDRLYEALAKVKKDLAAKLAVYKAGLERQLRTIAKEKTHADKRKMELELETERIEHSMVKSHLDWKQDKRRVAQRNLYLQQSFTAQSRTYYEHLVSPVVPATEKWLYHQYWNLMFQDMQWLERYEQQQITQQATSGG